MKNHIKKMIIILSLLCFGGVSPAWAESGPLVELAEVSLGAASSGNGANAIGLGISGETNSLSLDFNFLNRETFTWDSEYFGPHLSPNFDVRLNTSARSSGSGDKDVELRDVKVGTVGLVGARLRKDDHWQPTPENGTWLKSGEFNILDLGYRSYKNNAINTSIEGLHLDIIELAGVLGVTVKDLVGALCVKGMGAVQFNNGSMLNGKEVDSAYGHIGLHGCAALKLGKEGKLGTARFAAGLDQYTGDNGARIYDSITKLSFENVNSSPLDIFVERTVTQAISSTGGEIDVDRRVSAGLTYRFRGLSASSAP